MTPQVLPKRFYERNPKTVAQELLGTRLIRMVNDLSLEGLIVETEAYYGLDDPASRAHLGMKKFNQLMWGEPGQLFIYNVHQYWMLNVVAHKPGQIGAVLIRALQPVKGINIMRRNRPVNKDIDLTNGPGKLTLALKIDKSFNGVVVTSHKNAVCIMTNACIFVLGSSPRIGVKKDLDIKLRFYIEGNDYVSR